MMIFFKTQNPCQDSRYCIRQTPARNKGITRSFSVSLYWKFSSPCAKHTTPPRTNGVPCEKTKWYRAGGGEH